MVHDCAGPGVGCCPHRSHARRHHPARIKRPLSHLPVIETWNFGQTFPVDPCILIEAAVRTGSASRSLRIAFVALALAGSGPALAGRAPVLAPEAVNQAEFSGTFARHKQSAALLKVEVLLDR